MGLETERKFLVTGDHYRDGATKEFIHQGFLNDDMQRMVRVRIKGETAYLTIKGPLKGATRLEYEYPIPMPDALALLEQLCIPPTLSKLRYTLVYEENVWEVDEFMDENEGLVIAEVEIHRDSPLILPGWVGKEVTGDRRYYNAHLVTHPYSSWK